MAPAASSNRRARPREPLEATSTVTVAPVYHWLKQANAYAFDGDADARLLHSSDTAALTEG